MRILLRKGLGALGLESGAELLGSVRELPDDWELELAVMHLHHMLASAHVIWDGRGVDDLDRTRVGSVSASHLLVQLPYSTIDVHVAELLVHVVRVGTAVISQPDAIVLHLGWGLVVKLVHGQQLATTLLRLVESLHEVPEPRLRQHDVPGEDPHAVDLRLRVLGSGSSASHDLVLVHVGLQGFVDGELSLAHGCNTRSGAKG
mmetsp:Transcript_22090/g.41651  ORF Transcript_22090/g.41651 Transcript_22090/m.41651 type:complete len:203 (+) Transcript_22090:63-671(+)